jgi:hypothetical protein
MGLIRFGYWQGDRTEGWPEPHEFVDPNWDAKLVLTGGPNNGQFTHVDTLAASLRCQSLTIASQHLWRNEKRCGSRHRLFREFEASSFGTIDWCTIFRARSI